MEKVFAEKVTIKAGGAFRNFPRFAYSHCNNDNNKVILKTSNTTAAVKKGYVTKVT